MEVFTIIGINVDGDTQVFHFEATDEQHAIKLAGEAAVAQNDELFLPPVAVVRGHHEINFGSKEKAEAREWTVIGVELSPAESGKPWGYVVEADSASEAMNLADAIALEEIGGEDKLGNVPFIPAGVLAGSFPHLETRRRPEPIGPRSRTSDLAERELSAALSLPLTA
jgi:hypothetical protein